ncbi:Spore germination protein OS=Ureibacillus acetophenoni OX=614649 GN=SAMN05877842_10677 PE=3 SV=1 [Ureibacillus acetophenoni]
MGTYLYHFHPKIWKRVKENWETDDNYFSSSKITFDVNVNIERPGTINKTTDGGTLK